MTYVRSCCIMIGHVEAQWVILDDVELNTLGRVVSH